MHVLEQVAVHGRLLQRAAAGYRDDGEHEDRALLVEMNDRAEPRDRFDAKRARRVPAELAPLGPRRLTSSSNPARR